MNRLMVILAALALVAFAACSKKEEATAPPDTVDEGVFDPMVDTIDRARQVETEVENRVKEMNRKLEEIEGNDQP